MNTFNTNRLMMARRRGSILIFVVGILVLLALMGTAYVAAVRLDRVQVSQIGGAGALSGGWMTPPAQQMNLAEQEVIGSGATPSANSIKGRLLADLFGTGYRLGTGYNNYDMLGHANDFWLASRVPSGTTPAPQWPVISRNITADGSADPYRSQFAAPHRSGGGPTYPTYQNVQPSSIPITYPAMATPMALSGKTRVYPAFDIGGNLYLAADTDGDGIADAGLVDLSRGGTDANYTFAQYHPQFGGAPIVVPAGVTPAPNNRIYAAIRVVDNNAALNLNTAWKFQNQTLAGAAAPNYGWFRSNVDLRGLMTDQTGPQGFDNVFAPWRQASAAGTYASVAEGLDLQIARTMSGSSFIPEGETSNLLYHGGMIEPGRSMTTAEGKFLNDLYYSAANFAWDASKQFGYFPADQWDAWYKATHYTAGSRAYGSNSWDPAVAHAPAYPTGLPVPKRMHVVTSNPLTNSIPAVYAGAPNTPLVVAGGGYEGMEGYDATGAVSPKKVDVNTATFGRLWMGFWNVMADVPNNNGLAPEDITALAGAGSQITVRNGTINDPRQILELRSAIAAVNVEDMRDTDEDVSAHKIRLTAGPEVTVYGSEKQPFFKSVDYDGVNLTVELHNPYAANITSTFEFRLISHASGAAMTTIGGAAAVNGMASGNGTPIVLNGVGLPQSADLALVRLAKNGDWVVVDAVDLSTGNATDRFYDRDVATWALADAGGSFRPTQDDYGNIIEFPVAISNTPGGTTTYPYGGFPRVGDVMLVPYAGSYTIGDPGTAWDRVPVTRDIQQVAAAGANEMTGRLVPSDETHFAARIFDVFNVVEDPSPNGYNKAAHGYVNLNSAPLDILKKLPIIVDGAGEIDPAANDAAATAINTYRTGTGPLGSLAQLIQVPGFDSGPSGPADGDFLTGIDAAATGNFKRWHLVNRLSNMATTRSDSFTVYALIQAWQDAEQANPVLVAERRVAFILDRSMVTSPQGPLILKTVNTD